MKKAALLLAVLTSGSVFAENAQSEKFAIDIGLYPSAPAQTIDGIQFDDSHIIFARFARLNRFGKLGWYAEIGITGNEVDESGDSVKPYLEYAQYGVGANYTLNDKITLNASTGISVAQGTYTFRGDRYESNETVSETYTSFGANYKLFESAHVGLTYQTAAQSIGFSIGAAF